MCNNKKIEDVKSAMNSNIKQGSLEPRDNVTIRQPVVAGNPVTTGHFVTMIVRALKCNTKQSGDNGFSVDMDYALHRGIIEEYDIGNENYLIERRAAARIAHKALLIELGERDEDEWSAANALQDLYICRTCVLHIAQMYVKGIMLGRDNSMFDVKGKINYDEALSIVERMLDRKKRIPQTEGRMLLYRKLSPDEAFELVSKDKRAMIIDVRTNEEYMAGHIEGSICIPLKAMSNNPFSISENRDIPILLYCTKGYKSTIAAQVLLDAGYSRIYVIPGIEQHKYNLCK